MNTRLPTVHGRPDGGFSLVEVLMVVAILGILASFAMPAYQRYVYRAEAAEMTVKVDRLREALTELQAITGKRIGADIRVWVRTVLQQDTGGSDGHSYVEKTSSVRTLTWCPNDAAGTCQTNGQPVNGMNQTSLESTRLGLRFDVTAGGALTRGRADGAYVVAIQLPRDNPRATQVALSFAEEMRPSAERVDVSSRAVVLYFRLYDWVKPRPTPA